MIFYYIGKTVCSNNMILEYTNDVNTMRMVVKNDNELEELEVFYYLEEFIEKIKDLENERIHSIRQ